MQASELNQKLAKVTYVLREALPLSRFGVGFGVQWLRHGGKVSDEAYYQLLADHILHSDLTPQDAAYFDGLLQQRGLPRWAVLSSFFRLPDSVERKFLHGRAFEAHHAARVKLVRQHLPPAKRVLDLGGASETNPEGALLAMGYPSVPKDVWIVDLPVADRVGSRAQISPQAYTTPKGTSVRYVYTKMSDLSYFKDGEFDLVWSGQSIEHITEQEAEGTIAEVFRVLQPGGWFCLDTPNKRLSRLLSNEEFSHPDHKIEYLPSQLTDKLTRAGFVVESVKAVSPLPISARVGRLSKLEILDKVEVGDEAELGLSFFVKARKP